jgi:hypothetical protein
LLSRYNLSPHKEGYQFTTDSGISYTAYFSEYFLTTAAGEEVIVYSFGFECNEERSDRYDEKIRNTIVYIIEYFFEQKMEEGLLYVCLTTDGMARHRRITFGRWYKEIKSDIERYDCRERHAREGYYTSILVKSGNTRKDVIIEAFYNNLDTFFPPID